MKNNHPNLQTVISKILIFAVLIGVLPIYAQTKQGGKGVDVKIMSELPSKEKRWALIVGIDEYEKDISTLKGAVNDAKALKNLLINYAGFPENQIILLTSDAVDNDNRPKKENILVALNDLISKIPEDGLLLFSFSGHGVSVGNQAFLIPSNGRITKNQTLLKNLAIDVSEIRNAIQEIKVKQVLMFLDACRNEPGKGDTPNPLTDAYKQGFSFDLANSEVKAFATLYATTVGARAYEFYEKDSNQYRGYFSFAIEEALKGKAANAKGEVTLGRLINYLETNVPKKVKAEKDEVQIPSTTVSETYRANDLILTISQSLKLPVTNTTPNAKTRETVYWQSIKNSNKIEDFENYLSKCQNGEFPGAYKTNAEQKISQLKLIKNQSYSVSFGDVPVVKGKTVRRADTAVFGENYPDSIFLPDENVEFRTARKYKKLIMQVGVQDNPEAQGSKRFRIYDENGTLFENNALVNRRPVPVEIDISNSDLIGFSNYDQNSQPRDFVRYLNVKFVTDSGNPPTNYNVITNPAGVSWSKVQKVKGEIIPKANTQVFGEKYSNSIFLPQERLTFRTAKNFKKLIMKVGIQDNPNAEGSKKFRIEDENGTLHEGFAKVNFRAVTVEIGISNSDIITFSNYDENGQTREFVRYMNVIFVPKYQLLSGDCDIYLAPPKLNFGIAQ